MARITAALAVIALFAVFPSMDATQYIVGDDQGWNSGVDYYSWMDGKTFHVGDSLVFNYVPGDHNVIVAANYDVYDKCATTPNLGIWTSGNDVLTLPTTGTYYFLCEFHCDYTEQRIMVEVNS
ncbi:PREDICTED: basic blue protein-like [Fragaria vesca subsp. vesca]|uniref:basic blue protein-like n=1 Tax=Fragaria vesca subsp. vesca TaxID=101020 RepID=UPI0002C31A81|nr:PREDICTED: basic blue protein-like [Fragaria vesca subsp. vesca]